MSEMEKQLVFIDDSGDPGFKTQEGSSTHFVIACVIFDNVLDAEETALTIKRYKQELGWKETREFKFNKTHKKYIKELLRRVAHCPFRVRAILIDKSHIYSRELMNKHDSFYNFAIKEVLAKSMLKEADIRLDGHSGREYKRSAATYFRRELNKSSRRVAKVRFVDSNTNVLIQLADLVAGSILRTTQLDKTDCGEYAAIMHERVEDIWRFR